MTRRTVLVLAGVLLIQTVIVALVFTPQPHGGGDNAGYISLAHSLLDRGAYLELGIREKLPIPSIHPSSRFFWRWPSSWEPKAGQL